MEKLILKNISLLNKTSFLSLTDDNNISIIGNFTEAGIKILNADFGFACAKFDDSKKYKFIYKSSNVASDLDIPKMKAGGRMENKRGDLFFDRNVKKENYELNSAPLFGSYIIIPIRYGDHVYGSIVLCYKKQHNFKEEEFILCETIKNNIAQIITINWLVEKEQKALALAETQKEMQVLIDQDKIRTQFIANATHELRTPLAIMRGNVDLALRDKKVKSATSALRIVRNEIAHLSDILADLATLTSHNGHQRKATHSTSVDIISLLDRTIGRLHVLLNKKNIKVKFSRNKNKEICIRGDEQYLEKLFINLLRNAVTYGKEDGHISINITRTKSQAIISIEDDGMGISKQDLPYVFERFYRSQKAREMTSIGTGLGLAIAKWVAESHKGTIDVKSVEGKGSTFTVTLPIKK